MSRNLKKPLQDSTGFSVETVLQASGFSLEELEALRQN